MSFLIKLLKPALKWFVAGQAKKNLPNYNDTVLVDYLNGTVEITRDKWGVPHIYAENRSDLFFAQGFVHAQERLWQMELMRRVVSGRMCEVVGEDALEVDRITRIMGFKRLGEADVKRFENHELLPLLEAYINGVNTFLSNCKHLPVEFKLLKIKPEDWTMSDCFGMARLLAMQMSQGWLHELERMGLADKFGLERAQELFPNYPLQNPAALKYGIETNRQVDGTLEAFKGPYLKPLGGSNNWVVAPHKMVTGFAALCNDPHLLVNAPNIWFENHLVAPDYENTGVSIPGVPMILIGHNRNIAWGATLSYADIQDTYIEKFTGDNCRQYHFGDRILKSTHRTEKIYIKGQAQPHEEEVIETHHGPVILSVDELTKISLCSKALQDNDMIIGFYELNVAENWDDFVGACEKVSVPSLSLVYADTKQNIGYYMTGEVPLRARSKGLLPNPGYDAQHEWTGRVPFGEMPHVLNPEQGYFYTCNHKLVPDDFPYDLGDTWMNGYRAKRLDALFNTKEQFTMDDFAAWQMDFYCIPGLEFAELVRVLKGQDAYNTLPGRVKATAELLLDWDGYLTADTVGGTVYQVLKQSLIDLMFDDKLLMRGDIYRPELPVFHINEFFGYDTVTILRLFKNPASSWWVKSPEETLIEALKQTEAYLTERLGANQKEWKWGQLHRIVAKHALGVKEPLGEIFDVGNVPIGGDTDTVCQIAFVPGKHYDGTMIAASYRQLIDMGNLANSKCIAPVGQSGNVESPHYSDQMDMWVKGEFKPMIWTKEQVEAHKKATFTLKPM